MDQKTHESAKQTVLDFKCEKILPSSEKSTALSSSSSVKISEEEPKLECETPQKISEPVQRKSHESDVKLPKNFREIAETFDRMNCSLRLLGLRKKSTTFVNVSAQVRVLTKRDFLYKNLAQIKFILPEGLQIDKIITHDEKTLLMKPDMKITLLLDVVKGHSEVSDYVALSKVFSSRLHRYFTKIPEASDVPEAILPEPFNRTSLITVPDESPEVPHLESQSISESVILSPNFRRHFSNNADVAVSRTETEQKEETRDQSSGLCSESVAVSPLAKPAQSGDSFMTQTPLPSIPRRSVATCEDNLKTAGSQKSTHSCQPAKRVLDFSESEGDENAFSLSADKPWDISQITKGVSEEEIGAPMCDNTFSLTVENVDLIHSLFVSVNFSPITKEELVHKIIMNNLDIVDKGEVEELLDRLEKQVPDWMIKKSLPGGFIIYNLEKGFDLVSVRAKLTGS